MAKHNITPRHYRDSGGPHQLKHAGPPKKIRIPSVGNATVTPDTRTANQNGPIGDGNLVDKTTRRWPS